MENETTNPTSQACTTPSPAPITTEPTATVPVYPAKRKPGRPPGSKNKKRVA